jgi:hypothetical protein
VVTSASQPPALREARWSTLMSPRAFGIARAKREPDTAVLDERSRRTPKF